MRLATMNIQTLCRSTVQHQLLDYMRRQDIDSIVPTGNQDCGSNAVCG